MANKVFLVYQDCALCGARKNWGEAQLAIAKGENIEIEFVPFTKVSEEINAKELILKAAKKGMTLPFFTDGKKFSKTVELFKKKAREDGADSEAV